MKRSVTRKSRPVAPACPPGRTSPPAGSNAAPAAPPRIGPGALDAGTGTFMMQIPGWLDVQCYVASGMHLPTDTQTMRAQLPVDPPGGMDQFADLVGAYKTLHDHCQYWNDVTFQDAVSCAGDIVHYNEKVPIYYGAITQLLPQLEQDPPDPKAVQEFEGIIRNLASQAQGYADHAESVHQGMKTFAEQTSQDKLTLRPLTDRYETQLGNQSPIIQQISQELAKDRAELQSWEDEYNHDVVVAATVATYIWIPIYGWIAGAIVAGVYGAKATDALNHVNGLKAAISTISDQLQAAAILLLDLQRIHSDLADISGKLAAALPVLETMQGAWTSIAGDMKNILTIIEQDIRQVPAIIKSLGIDEAIAAWAALAKEADVYRGVAFITVTTPAAAAVAGHLLVHQLQRLSALGRRARQTAPMAP